MDIRGRRMPLSWYALVNASAGRALKNEDLGKGAKEGFSMRTPVEVAHHYAIQTFEFYIQVGFVSCVLGGTYVQ